MKTLKAVLNHRIATKDGNFIAISSGEYGSYYCYWLDSNMSNPRLASIEQWVWATSWGTPIEQGSWEVTCQVDLPEDSTLEEIPFNVRFQPLESQLYLEERWVALRDATSYMDDNLPFDNWVNQEVNYPSLF